MSEETLHTYSSLATCDCPAARACRGFSPAEVRKMALAWKFFEECIAIEGADFRFYFCGNKRVRIPSLDPNSILSAAIAAGLITQEGIGL